MSKASIIAMMLMASFVACSGGNAERQTVARLQAELLPSVKFSLNADIKNHTAAIQEVAKRLGPGFAVKDATLRETEMRSALRWMRHRKKGVPAMVASPASFIAAVANDGVVIARDKTPDAMAGKDFKSRFDVVQKALAGEVAVGMGEFMGAKPEDPTSLSLLFAAPAKDAKGNVVGAVLAGIPLTRWSQRLNRQYRIDHIEEFKAGVGTWTFLVADGRLFHMSTPPEVVALAKEILNAPKEKFGPKSSPESLWTSGKSFVGLRASLGLSAAKIEMIAIAPAK